MTDIIDNSIMLGRREYDRQLSLIDKKLDDLTESMLEMSKTLQQLAIQNYQIQSLQTAQNEMRNDLSSLNEKVQKLFTNVSTCAVDFKAHKQNVTVLWTIFTTITIGIIGTYLTHMMGNGK